jgi:dTDP-D-glucose 4,6-dehydratase
MVGIVKVVDWHSSNQAWLDEIISGRYQGHALGMAITTSKSL